MPEPGPSESTEASAVTAPQVKFPPCGPAPLLPHRTRSQDTPPPHCLPACRFLLRLPPGKSAQRRLHTTSRPPAPAVPEDGSQLHTSPHAHFLGATRWGWGLLTLDSKSRGLDSPCVHCAHSRVTSHRFLTTNHFQICSLPLSSRPLSRLSN